MKNPISYNKKGKVHPSPPPPPPSPASAAANFLSLLPAAILALAAALSPQDREVLAYLLSSSSDKNSRKATAGGGGHGDHGPAFGCSCFRCYTTFWARWDASPSRHVIHDIIEAYEEALQKESAAGGRQKRSKKRSAARRKEEGVAVAERKGESPAEHAAVSAGGEVVDGCDLEKSAVRKIVSFMGDRISGIFGGV